MPRQVRLLLPQAPWDNSAATDIYGSYQGEIVASGSGFDLCDLLEASDEELGIPPNPVLILKNDICVSMKETSEGLLESPSLKSLGENRHFEVNFENYRQRRSLGYDPATGLHN